MVPVFLAIPIASYTQILTVQEVVEKSIMYHDPANRWGALHGVLDFKETHPDGNYRNTPAEIDNIIDYFNLVRLDEKHALSYIYNKGACNNTLVFEEEISEEEINTVGLLKIPKSRKWFVNKDNTLLGEDILENVLFLN